MRFNHVCVICLFICLSLGTAALAAEEEQPVHWDIDSLARAVQPMKQQLRGHLPMLVWNLPLPRDNELVAMRRDGRLRKAIDLLAARGMVPTVGHGLVVDARGCAGAGANAAGSRAAGQCAI